MIEELQSFNNNIKDHCHNCDQKSLLIQKYQKLIRLLKKKETQNNSELSSKVSHGKTSTHTSEATSSSHNSSPLFFALHTLVLKRQSFFFYLLDRNPTKKFLIMSLVNKIKKHTLRRGFRKILNFTSPSKLTPFKHIDQRLRKSVAEAFEGLREAGTVAMKGAVGEEEEIVKNMKSDGIINNFKQIHSHIKYETAYNVKELARRNVQLEISNSRLLKENQNLKGLLEEYVRRQNKENQKKKESLQMLAEELFQKNELILQLQGTIKTYEKEYGICTNILDDDVVALRKEVDGLESLRDKLENQLTKNMNKVQKLSEKEELLSQSLTKYEKQNVILRQKLFDLQAKDISRNNLSLSLQSLIKTFNSKLKQLKVYQKQMKKLRQTNSTQIPPSLEHIQQQSKAEIILCFLQNISLPDYQLPTLLFDQEELSVLINHHKNYQKLIQLHPQKRTKAVTHELDGSNSIDDEIQLKGREIDDSLFSVVNREEKDEGKFTMKLLELELQKSKQIGKISQLKEKLMHIRMVILNLLKSLQMKNTSQQCQGIVRILFDIFEYSEEEREEVLAPKRKKLFGFI